MTTSSTASEAVFAATAEQLEEARALGEKAHKLVRATEQQACVARELAESTERLVGKAKGTLGKANAVTAS